MENTGLELAKTLFELESDSIFNDPESHWWVNDWTTKYGEDSIKHCDFTYTDKNVQELANIMQEDYSNNVLDTFEYKGGERYDYYYGFITECFEKQLAVKTKVGFQLTF